MQSKILILFYLFYFYFTFSEAANARLNRPRVSTKNELSGSDKFGKRQEPVVAAEVPVGGEATSQEAVNAPAEAANPNPLAEVGAYQPDATDCAKQVQAEKPDDPVGEFLKCLGH